YFPPDSVNSQSTGLTPSVLSGSAESLATGLAGMNLLASSGTLVLSAATYNECRKILKGVNQIVFDIQEVKSVLFAFTATPKNKTLEMFGEPLPPDAEGKIKHKPFHIYTMKQAIEEGFILDVLRSYTPVDSYYKLVKKVEADPEFYVQNAPKNLRK